jgi:hypothetical protein
VAAAAAAAAGEGAQAELRHSLATAARALASAQRGFAARSLAAEAGAARAAAEARAGELAAALSVQAARVRERVRTLHASRARPLAARADAAAPEVLLLWERARARGDPSEAGAAAMPQPPLALRLVWAAAGTLLGWRNTEWGAVPANSSLYDPRRRARVRPAAGLAGSMLDRLDFEDEVAEARASAASSGARSGSSGGDAGGDGYGDGPGDGGYGSDDDDGGDGDEGAPWWTGLSSPLARQLAATDPTAVPAAALAAAAAILAEPSLNLRAVHALSPVSAVVGAWAAATVSAAHEWVAAHARLSRAARTAVDAELAGAPPSPPPSFAQLEFDAVQAAVRPGSSSGASAAAAPMLLPPLRPASASASAAAAAAAAVGSKPFHRWSEGSDAGHTAATVQFAAVATANEAAGGPSAAAAPTRPAAAAAAAPFAAATAAAAAAAAVGGALDGQAAGVGRARRFDFFAAAEASHKARPRRLLG